MSVVTPSWATSAILSIGAVILAKRLATAIMESRSRSAAIELSRHDDLIRQLAARFER